MESSHAALTLDYDERAPRKAKLVEHTPGGRGVAGSSPVIPTIFIFYRDIAQIGRALRSGRRGRGFNSRCPDHFIKFRFLYLPGHSVSGFNSKEVRR